MFLTPKELSALTGAAQKAKQVRWLQERGFPHEVDSNGRPVVLLEAVRARLGAVEAPASEPNWEALGR